MIAAIMKVSKNDYRGVDGLWSGLVVSRVLIDFSTTL
jgi:hypothetical protein